MSSLKWYLLLSGLPLTECSMIPSKVNSLSFRTQDNHISKIFVASVRKAKGWQSLTRKTASFEVSIQDLFFGIRFGWKVEEAVKIQANEVAKDGQDLHVLKKQQ